MERLKRIQEEFKGISGSIGLYIDAVKLFYVDVDQDILEGYKYVTASCGCCSDTEDWEGGLGYELEYMDEADYQELIEELKRLKEDAI
jgi:hypothetical protein